MKCVNFNWLGHGEKKFQCQVEGAFKNYVDMKEWVGDQSNFYADKVS